MSQNESEAIVIKSYNLSEADRIVVLFTRDFGVVRAVAKGAKRLKSKYGSSLEPFSTVRIEFYQKEERELVSLVSAELQKSRFEIASDPAYLELFSYIGELLTDLTPPHEADETLYRMVAACMDVPLDEARIPAVRLYFELWLLRLSGYLPVWDKCAACGRAIGDAEDARLISGFHLNCIDCRKNYPIADVSPGERRMFFDVQRLSPAAFVDEIIDRDFSPDTLSAMMRRLLALALGREVSAATPTAR